MVMEFLRTSLTMRGPPALAGGSEGTGYSSVGAHSAWGIMGASCMVVGLNIFYFRKDGNIIGQAKCYTCPLLNVLFYSISNSIEKD
jgi:hypothetical protein